MAEYYVSVPIGGWAELPLVEKALRTTVPDIMRSAWRRVASEHYDTGEYVAAIEKNDAVEMRSRDVVSVVNRARHASILEFGRRGFHLPSVWGNWRIGAKGQRYARVPFRHYSPVNPSGGMSTSRIRQQMPMDIYRMARRLAVGERLVNLGDRYRRTKNYEAMRKAGEPVPAELGKRYRWKVSKYEGLFRTPVRQRGGGSVYMTIRTIKPESKGWYVPTMAPLRLAEKAMDLARPALEEVLSAAIADDIEAIMQLRVDEMTDGLL